MQVMLAGKFIPEKVEKHLPVFVQPKLDGIRMFVRDKIAYSRSLKPIRSQWVQSLITEEMEGLDGELICGEPTAKDCYNRTSSSIMSFDKPDDVTFHVFDHWAHGGSFSERLSYLCNANEIDPMKKLQLPDFCKIVDTKLMYSLQEISEYESEMLALGHEGLIIRNPHSSYKFGRGSPTNCELIKVKQFADAEAVVIGFSELLHNENEATTDELGYTERSSHQENLIPMDTLGALLTVGKFSDGSVYQLRIGTGFDAATRKEIWDNRDKYLNRFVKFKYFPGGVKNAPRFPVFLGFREEFDMSVKQKSQQEQMKLF